MVIGALAIDSVASVATYGVLSGGAGRQNEA
jgi:hypothetical protein